MPSKQRPDSSIRVEVYVRPRSSKTVVGGSYDGALLVRVAEPAHEGRATEAALRAVARALGVPQGSVVLVRGATAQRKLIEITVARDRLPTLRGEIDRFYSM